MLGSFGSGWELAKAVRRNVSSNRNLYLYPIIIGIISVVIFILTFITLIIAIPFSSAKIYFYYYIVGIFIAYILVYFVSTLLILAMMISYRSIKNGEEYSLRYSISRAWEYKGYAFEWAILYSVILMILRAIESRIRGIGAIIVGGVGSFAITVATFFAVPVILDYKVGPVKAIEKSIDIIKKNFGNTFGGVVYIDLYTLIFIGGGFLLLIASFFLISSSIPIMILAFMFAVSIILIIYGIVLNFTYTNIFKLMLFDYINGRGLPQGIDENMINSAIKRKNGFNNGSF